MRPSHQPNLETLLNSGYRYALSLTHDKPDAQDLVQEAWLRVYRRKGHRISRALLFTAIRNLYIDHYRRNHLVVYEPFDESAHSNPESPTGDHITSEDLEAALEQLKPEERESIYLNVVEGYTAKEIAKMTDRPRGTVLSLINRGKQKLAQRLTQLTRNRHRDSG